MRMCMPPSSAVFWARARVQAPTRSCLLTCHRPAPRAAFSGRVAETRSRGVARSEAPEHVLVIGGGALGSLFAGRLGALKNLQDRVWMLTSWEEQAQVLCVNE